MSMIKNISESLREFRKRLRDATTLYVANSDCDLLDQAADTIEELSLKLHNSQMERSSQYYGGGWISVEERLPEITVIGYGDTRYTPRICLLPYVGMMETLQPKLVGITETERGVMIARIVRQSLGSRYRLFMKRQVISSDG